MAKVRAVMEYHVSKLPLVALLLFALAPSPLSAAPGDDHYAVAAGHYARGRWELAADEFRTLLAEYPKHPKCGAARFYLGEALVQLAQYESAHQAFEQFLQQAEDDPRARQALFRVGETSYLAGAAERAAGELQTFAERFPDDELNGYVLPYLGDLSLRAKNWEAARGHYQLAIDGFPAGPLVDDCRYGLARALEKLNQRSAAEGLYAEVAKKRDDGLSADARYQLGSAQYARGDFAAAAATLAEFTSASPEHPLAEQAKLAEGWSRYRLKEFDKARALFAQLTASGAIGLEARYWLGLTQKAEGDWNAAAETLTQAATAAGSHALAASLHFHGGESLLKAGKPKQADAEFARVITAYPDCEWVDAAWLGRARAALALGDHPLVEHHAAHFAERCPTSDKRWAVERVRADSLIAQREYEAAVKLLEPLSTGDPDARATASHQLALAVANLGAGRADEALALAESLPADAADHVLAESKLTRAQALVALNRFAEAAPLVEQCLKTESDPARLAVCRAQLAICSARTGDLAGAKSHYQQFLAAEPEKDLLAATTSYLATAARDAGDLPWSDQLLAAATSERMPATYAAGALATRGWSEYQAGAYEQAAATLARLLEQFPDHAAAPQGAYTRGQALEKLGRDDDALKAYQWILNRQADGDLIAKALLGSARIHDRHQRHAAASAAYDRLLRDYPQLAERDAVLYQSAWNHLALDKPWVAQRLFEQLRKEFPQSKLSADAAFRLAEQAREARDYERAATLLDEVLSSSPEPALLEHALYAQGQLAAARRQWSEVAEPLERLKRELPDCSLILLADYWLAEAAYRLNDFDQADERFAALAAATEGRQENWVAATALRRAQLAAQREDWPLARELAERFARDYSNFDQQYEADYVLGRALAGQALFAEARDAYARVLKSAAGGKTETAAMAQWMIGETYLHQKNYQAALKEYLRLEILYAYPTWQAGALLQAGKCQELLGQSAEAGELYTRVVAEYPESEFAAEAGQRLEALGLPDRSVNRPQSSAKGSRL